MHYPLVNVYRLLRCKYSNKYFKNLKIKLKQTKISEKRAKFNVIPMQNQVFVGYFD